MTTRALADPFRATSSDGLSTPAGRRPLQDAADSSPFADAMRAERKSDAGRKNGAQQTKSEPARPRDVTNAAAPSEPAAGRPAGATDEVDARRVADPTAEGADLESNVDRASAMDTEPTGEVEGSGRTADGRVDGSVEEGDPQADVNESLTSSGEPSARSGTEGLAPVRVDADGSRRRPGGQERPGTAEGGGNAVPGGDAAEATGGGERPNGSGPMTIRALNDLLARADKALLLRVAGLSAGRVGVSMNGFAGTAERPQPPAAETAGTSAPGAAPVAVPADVPARADAAAGQPMGDVPVGATVGAKEAAVPEGREAASAAPATSGAAKPDVRSGESNGGGATPAVFRLVSEGRSTSHAVRPGTPSAAGPSPEAFEAQVARGLAAALQQRGGSVTLRLHPETLGQLRVQMELAGGTVSVRLAVGSAQARDLLDSTLANLRSSLEAKGLSVEKVDVRIDPSLARPPGEQAGRHGATGREDPGSGTNGGADGAGSWSGGSGAAGRDAGPSGGWGRAGGTPSEPGAERPAEQIDVEAAPGHGVLDRVTLRLDAVA